MKKIIIIDGNSLAFGRVPEEGSVPDKISKSSIDNRDIFIVRKFIKKILRFKYSIFSGYELAVIFDEPDKVTFRHEMSSRYKTKKISESRTKQKKYIYEQIDEIKKVLSKMNIPFYSHKNWEADDIIGMLVEKLEKKNYLTTIVSGDKDILQLISKKTRVAYLKNQLTFEMADRRTVWNITDGIWPDQVIDIKILAGDKSDNIKGIGLLRSKGVVDYWTSAEATEHIKIYGSIKGMLNQIERIKEPYKGSLSRAEEKIIFNRKLVTIVREWVIDANFEYFLNKKIDIDGLEYVVKDLRLEKLLNNKRIKINLEEDR